MLSLAGTKPPPGRLLEGVDLLPILAGEKRGLKRTLYWRRVGPNWVKTHRAVRDGNWKLIEERNGKCQLYNLAEDLGEKRNLAEEQKSKVVKMKKLLDKWENQVDPPLYPVSLKANPPD